MKLEVDHHGRKLRASSMLQEPLLLLWSHESIDTNDFFLTLTKFYKAGTIDYRVTIV